MFPDEIAGVTGVIEKVIFDLKKQGCSKAAAKRIIRAQGNWARPCHHGWMFDEIYRHKISGFDEDVPGYYLKSIQDWIAGKDPITEVACELRDPSRCLGHKPQYTWAYLVAMDARRELHKLEEMDGYILPSKDEIVDKIRALLEEETTEFIGMLENSPDLRSELDEYGEVRSMLLVFQIDKRPGNFGFTPEDASEYIDYQIFIWFDRKAMTFVLSEQNRNLEELAEDFLDHVEHQLTLLAAEREYLDLVPKYVAEVPSPDLKPIPYSQLKAKAVQDRPRGSEPTTRKGWSRAVKKYLESIEWDYQDALNRLIEQCPEESPQGYPDPLSESAEDLFSRDLDERIAQWRHDYVQACRQLEE